MSNNKHKTLMRNLRHYRASELALHVSCEHCGVDMPASFRRSRRFCSDACRAAAYRAKSAPPLLSPPKTCKLCGAVMPLATARRVFCNQQCRNDFNRGVNPARVRRYARYHE